MTTPTSPSTLAPEVIEEGYTDKITTIRICRDKPADGYDYTAPGALDDEGYPLIPWQLDGWNANTNQTTEACWNFASHAEAVAHIQTFADEHDFELIQKEPSA